eukprot:TRINITY_DN3246_c0_g1_i1.p1 TRINITY_DN3246_c0_g1~~TRINITY_DN3246_c0_g1_i1.p1  ORF type:complete len:191 (+),score=43.64 TRINITY_DN3246_c0_g1_i1:34-573(+)
MSTQKRIQTKQVASGCIDFLVMEMVATMLRNNTEVDAAFIKLEKMGFTVGQRLIERLSTNRGSFQDDLDVMKFICKDLWNEVYQKNVDNLRTNHKGTFVLRDNKFPWLKRHSTGKGGNATELAAPYVAFPCGLIRGALENLGIEAQVTVEIDNLPCCEFTIVCQQPNSNSSGGKSSSSK